LVSAVAIHSYNKRVHERVASVVNDRKSMVLSGLFNEKF